MVLIDMTVKMKKPGISWLFVDAGFQFGAIFDDVHAKEGFVVLVANFMVKLRMECFELRTSKKA